MLDPESWRYKDKWVGWLCCQRCFIESSTWRWVITPICVKILHLLMMWLYFQLCLICDYVQSFKCIARMLFLIMPSVLHVIVVNSVRVSSNIGYNVLPNRNYVSITYLIWRNRYDYYGNGSIHMSTSHSTNMVTTIMGPIRNSSNCHKTTEKRGLS